MLVQSQLWRRKRIKDGATACLPALACDLPASHIGYLDTLLMYNRRQTNVVASSSGSYTFLETAEFERN
jgi:hypothetical protein